MKLLVMNFTVQQYLRIVLLLGVLHTLIRSIYGCLEGGSVTTTEPSFTETFLQPWRWRGVAWRVSVYDECQSLCV